MSKLTNYQIRAQITGLEAALRAGKAAGRSEWDAVTRRRRAKLAGYRQELAAREAAGCDPGTEIQSVRHT